MKSYYKIILIISISFLLFQCKANKECCKKEKATTEEHDHNSHSHGDEHDHNEGGEDKQEHFYVASRTEADTMKANGLNVVYFCYFKLSDQLSLEDKTKAADYAGSMYRAIMNVVQDDLPISMKYAWQVRAKLIKESATNISIAAKDLEKQRSYVSQLSLNIMELIKLTKIENPIYLFYCDSSNKNKGGSWLSKEDSLETSPYQSHIVEPCGFRVETIFGG